MGYRDLAHSIAKSVFVTVGDIPLSCTYRNKSAESPTYDPTAGTVTDAYSEYSVDMVFTSYKSEEIDGVMIRVSDMKAMIPQDNLSCTPHMNDLIIKDSITWEVIGIRTDPAEAVWVFHLRKP